MAPALRERVRLAISVSVGWVVRVLLGAQQRQNRRGIELAPRRWLALIDAESTYLQVTVLVPSCAASGYHHQTVTEEDEGDEEGCRLVIGIRALQNREENAEAVRGGYARRNED